MTQKPVVAQHFRHPTSHTRKHRSKHIEQEIGALLFGTPKKNPEENSKVDLRRVGGKYPDNWKMFVLPGLETYHEQEHEGSKGLISVSNTTKCSQMSYRPKEIGGSTARMNLESMRSRSKSTQNYEVISSARTKRVKFQEPAEEQDSVVLLDPVKPTTKNNEQSSNPTRIELQNQYLREEVEYLRDKFSRCLQRKYKPGSKHLYD